ncbi:hypothetical protein L1987_77604 [Smallanthus sonchifolius]|uniref:Uncharacterized protein n=1 Tax=Smallanthus sonchifolius TaxID=185202 RepID=A0ACB8ZAV1_9ASTR|nr:hypothetical protein L1987_77604 [Smallanthus sonchifolius]
MQRPLFEFHRLLTATVFFPTPVDLAHEAFQAKTLTSPLSCSHAGHLKSQTPSSTFCQLKEMNVKKEKVQVKQKPQDENRSEKNIDLPRLGLSLNMVYH